MPLRSAHIWLMCPIPINCADIYIWLHYKWSLHLVSLTLHCSWLWLIWGFHGSLVEMWLQSDAAVINILNPETQMRNLASCRNPKHFYHSCFTGTQQMLAQLACCVPKARIRGSDALDKLCKDRLNVVKWTNLTPLWDGMITNLQDRKTNENVLFFSVYILMFLGIYLD